MKLEFELVFLVVQTAITQAELTIEDVMGVVHTLAEKHDNLDAKVSKIIEENNDLKRPVSDLQNRNDILEKNVTDLSLKYENIVHQSNAFFDEMNRREMEKLPQNLSNLPLRKVHVIKQFMKDPKQKSNHLHESYNNSSSSAQENSSQQSLKHHIKRFSNTDEFHNDKETSLKNIDKISFVDTDVGARVSLKCEETGVPGENTRGRTGRNLAISRIAPGSNLVRIVVKRSKRNPPGYRKPHFQTESEAPVKRRNAIDRSPRTISLPDITQTKQTKGSAKIAFHAQTQSEVRYTRQQRLVFGNVFLNRGSAYSENTGTFTSPVSGTYVFHTSIMTHSGQQIETQIVRNEQDTGCYVFSYNEDNYGFASNMVVMDINQGDEVWVHVVSSSHNNVVRTHFSGFILWENI